MSKKTTLWYRAHNDLVTLRHYDERGRWEFIVLSRSDLKELGWLPLLRKEYDYHMEQGFPTSASKYRYFLTLFLFGQ